jgi:hypothetical protein
MMFGFNSASESELKNETIDDVMKLELEPKWTPFWDNVRDWKVYCKRILRGQEHFTADEGFPTFESVMAFLGAVMFVNI